jgi:hypothetical protein
MEKFMKVLEKVSKELEYIDFPRLFLSKFWNPEKLFKNDKAELALKHVEGCKSVASRLESYIK